MCTELVLDEGLMHALIMYIDPLVVETEFNIDLLRNIKRLSILIIIQTRILGCYFFK
jgi:hypothetical protein